MSKTPDSDKRAATGYPPETLFARLRLLSLNRGEFAIFGSGPLAVRGLLPMVSDLDILVRGESWDRVKELGAIVMYGDDETVDLFNGLTFGRSWAYGTFDIDALIDEAEIIGGLPFVQLASVVEFKQIARRPKDLEHLALLESAGIA